MQSQQAPPELHSRDVDCRTRVFKSSDTPTSQCAADSGPPERGGVAPAADADAAAAAGGGTHYAEAGAGKSDPAQRHECSIYSFSTPGKSSTPKNRPL